MTKETRGRVWREGLVEQGLERDDFKEFVLA
jgi:hypothetical protein